jgi:hypothetical protein
MARYTDTSSSTVASLGLAATGVNSAVPSATAQCQKSGLLTW